MIKEARESDFDIAYDFIEKLWDYNSYDKGEMRAVYHEVLQDPNSFAFFVIEDDIYHGFCHGNFFHTFWLSGMTCYLSSIITRPEDRGKGYGIIMVDYVKELARARECKAIFLATGIVRKEAHRFYERYGFERSCYGFDLIL